MGQLAVLFNEVLNFTALAGSLDANDLSEEEQGRKSELDQVVANLTEARTASDGLPISVEKASLEDTGKEVELVVHGALKEQDIDFQPK